jgi:hypothetical protein
MILEQLLVRAHLLAEGRHVVAFEKPECLKDVFLCDWIQRQLRSALDERIARAPTAAGLLCKDSALHEIINVA